MDELHLSYLSLLRDLRGTLDQLSELAQKKTAAVRADDLIALDEVLKQEQAMALNLRGLELRRQKLVPQLGLEGTDLSHLTRNFPEHLHDQAKEVADALHESYTNYRSHAGQARESLELNLHQVEKVIAASGVDPKLAATGYETPNVEPPKKMKTDFRA